jgi:hypothetical protein
MALQVKLGDLEEEVAYRTEETRREVESSARREVATLAAEHAAMVLYYIKLPWYYVVYSLYTNSSIYLLVRLRHAQVALLYIPESNVCDVTSTAVASSKVSFLHLLLPPLHRQTGHSNLRQKIHHVQRLKEEVGKLSQDNAKLSLDLRRASALLRDHHVPFVAGMTLSTDSSSSESAPPSIASTVETPSEASQLPTTTPAKAPAKTKAVAGAAGAATQAPAAVTAKENNDHKKKKLNSKKKKGTSARRFRPNLLPCLHARHPAYWSPYSNPPCPSPAGT